VYPVDPSDVGEIPTLLQAYAGKYTAVGAPSMNLVGFYWVPLLDQETMAALQASSDVDGAFYYPDFYANTGYDGIEDDAEQPVGVPRDARFDKDLYYYDIGTRGPAPEANGPVNGSDVAGMEEVSPNSCSFSPVLHGCTPSEFVAPPLP
jgi:hypothetical protein